MKKITYNELIEGDSKYPAVIAVSKLAREIGDEMARKEERLEEKPVKMAIEALKEDKYFVCV